MMAWRFSNCRFVDEIAVKLLQLMKNRKIRDIFVLKALLFESMLCSQRKIDVRTVDRLKNLLSLVDFKGFEIADEKFNLRN